MQLISKETYEHEITLKESEKDGETTTNPVFILSKLTTAEVDRIDDATSIVQAKTSDVKVMVGKIKSLKIEYAVKGWKEVVDKEGKAVKCTSETKRLIPLGVRERLLEHIDETNGLGKQDEEDEAEKN